MPSMAGGRLDAVLAKAFPAFSPQPHQGPDTGRRGRDQWQDRQRAQIPRSSAGDDVVLVAPPPDDAEPEPENIPLDILYEDDAADRHQQAGRHGGAPCPRQPDRHAGQRPAVPLRRQPRGHRRRQAARHRPPARQGHLRRHGRGQDRAAHKHLAAQFADHGRTGPLHRAYTAFVWGTTETGRGTVDAPLGRDPNNRLKQAVRKDGREAITHYAVEARFGDEGWDITRIRCELETGRTHQIRVHMAHIGHPLVADPRLRPGLRHQGQPPARRAQGRSSQALGRQALHAAELGFEHPVTGEEMIFEAPLPPDLEALEDALEPFDKAFAR